MNGTARSGSKKNNTAGTHVVLRTKIKMNHAAETAKKARKPGVGNHAVRVESPAAMAGGRRAGTRKGASRKADAPRAVVRKVGVPREDAPRVDVRKAGGQKVGVPRTGAPKGDGRMGIVLMGGGRKADAPRVCAQKVGVPKAVVLKVDVPKEIVLRVVVPKGSVPKVNVPKAERRINPVAETTVDITIAGSPPRVAAVPGTRVEDHLTVADPRTAARAANAKVENARAVNVKAVIARAANVKVVIARVANVRAEARVKAAKGPLNLHLETVPRRARPDKNPNRDG